MDEKLERTVAGFAVLLTTVIDATVAGQLLGNPGFETGTAAAWSASSGVVSNSTSEPPHGGTWRRLTTRRR